MASILDDITEMTAEMCSYEELDWRLIAFLMTAPSPNCTIKMEFNHENFNQLRSELCEKIDDSYKNKQILIFENAGAELTYEIHNSINEENYSIEGEEGIGRATVKAVNSFADKVREGDLSVYQAILAMSYVAQLGFEDYLD